MGSYRTWVCDRCSQEGPERENIAGIPEEWAELRKLGGRRFFLCKQCFDSFSTWMWQIHRCRGKEKA